MSYVFSIIIKYTESCLFVYYKFVKTDRRIEKNAIVNDWIEKNINNSILFFYTNAHVYFALKKRKKTTNLDKC